MRVLITGAAGFAGGHLAAYLAQGGHEVIGVGHDSAFPVTFEYLALELLDADAVRSVVARLAPDRIAHLAAAASVKQSWQDPKGTIRKNVETTLNVLDAAGDAAVLVAGSGEVYGPPDELP